MKRTLVVGETVCIREESLRDVKREECTKAEAHLACTITDVFLNGRRVFALSVPWQLQTLYVWASQVRLADGATENLWRRIEKMAKEIEEMKAKRRNERKHRVKRQD